MSKKKGRVMKNKRLDKVLDSDWAYTTCLVGAVVFWSAIAFVAFHFLVKAW